VLRTRLAAIVLAAGGLWTVAALTGCSDSPSRRASEDLLRKVAEAQRNYEEALSLLSSPAYKIAGEYFPTTVPTQPAGKIELFPEQSVNPLVLTELERGDKLIGDALERDAAADDMNKSVALQMRGRIQALRGDYYAKIAAGAGDRARQAASGISEDLSLFRSQGGLLESYANLASATDDDVQNLLKGAEKEKAAVEDKIGQCDTKIAQRDKRHKELMAATEVQIGQAAKLLLESQKTPESGKSGQLLEQKFKLDAEIIVANTEIAKLGHEIESLKSQRDTLALQAKSAESLIKAAESILAQHKQSVDELAKQQETVTKAMAQTRNDIEVLAGQVVEAAAMDAAARKAAKEAFDSAASQFDQAKRLLKTDPSARGAAIQKAAVLTSLAEMDVRAIGLQARCTTVAGEVQKAWSGLKPPLEASGAIKDFQNYLPGADEVRKEAIRSYSDAATTFEDAARAVQPQLRWAYQARAAAAYIGLYELDNDAQSYEKARTILTQALENKEASPNLASVIQLKKLLDAQAPGSK